MIAYSHEYSTTYYPPAPVAEMMVRDVERKDPEICVIGMLDYGSDGSDVTMIPIDVLQAVGAQFVEKRQIRGVSGFWLPC